MKLRVLFLVVFLVVALLPLGAVAQQKPDQKQDQEPPVFRSQVNLVNVFCTVLDANGSPVADLQKKDFQLFEDGARQDIAVFTRESELPLSVILAIDTSLSTHKDLPIEIAAARRFVHTILRAQDSLSLFQFDRNVAQLVGFTHSLGSIDRALDNLRGGTSTSLYDALYLAGETLHSRRGRKVVVVITDGGDTTSQSTYQDALRSLIESEALVYSVIVVPIEASAGRDTGGEHALIQIARDTGGKFFYASSATDLDRVFRQIDKELRTQYLLGYYPKPHGNYAEFRKIEVRVQPPTEPVASTQPSAPTKPAYTVRHRTGYYPYRSVRDDQ
jgi:Ca-activated chloride channel family protein